MDYLYKLSYTISSSIKKFTIIKCEVIKEYSKTIDVSIRMNLLNDDHHIRSIKKFTINTYGVNDKISEVPGCIFLHGWADEENLRIIEAKLISLGRAKFVEFQFLYKEVEKNYNKPLEIINL